MENTNAEDNWNIAFNKLQIGREIGRGSFGRVFKATYLGLDVCVKELINTSIDFNEEFQHEVRMLKNLRHPLVVLFMGISSHQQGKYIVQEFVKGGSLLKILQNKTILIPWESRIKMGLEIAQAIAYLHEKNCLHRDLKCENVLIDIPSGEISKHYEHTYRCKVADFGLATIVDKKNSQLLDEVGAPWWRAPEVQTRKYNEKADVFSFGVVLLEIITRDLGEDIRLNMTYQIKSKNGLFFGVKPENLRAEYSDRIRDCPPQYFELALKCCSENPEERPDMSRVVEILQNLFSSFYEFINISRSKCNKEGAEVWIPLATESFDGKSTPKIKSSVLINVLTKRLESKTGRGLSDDEKKFLQSRISSESCTLEQFTDFWEWFHWVEELIVNKKVISLWRSGFIKGFVSKADAVSQLNNLNKENTFIIRFSESQKNSISIAYQSSEGVKHLLVRVESNGFIFGQTKFNCMRSCIEESFPFLQWLFPDHEWNGKKFADAHLEAEKAVLQERIKSFTSAYDDGVK